MIELVLPYPISANRYWATRVIRAKATGNWMAMTYVTPEAKAYREQCAWIAKQAGIRQPFDQRVRLDLHLFPQRPQNWKTLQRKFGATWDNDVRCIDLGNAEKVLADAFQGLIYTDDKWVWEGEKKRREPDDAGARVIVTITPIVLEQPQDLLL